MNHDSLTPTEAYLAMYAFLAKHYDLGCEELGGILGSMALLANGKPADPVFAQDWSEAIAAVKSGAVDAQLRLGRGPKT